MFWTVVYIIAGITVISWIVGGFKRFLKIFADVKRGGGVSDAVQPVEISGEDNGE